MPRRRINEGLKPLAQPDLTDPDNPEWTVGDFAQAEGPQALSAAELAAFPKTRVSGRPKSASPKVAISLRVEQSVLEAYKAQGAGWQTRMNEVLAKAIRGSKAARK